MCGSALDFWRRKLVVGNVGVLQTERGCNLDACIAALLFRHKVSRRIEQRNFCAKVGAE